MALMSRTQPPGVMSRLAKVQFVFGMTLASIVIIAALFSMAGWLLVPCLVLFAAWLVLTRTGQQAWSVAWVAIATIPQRAGASVVVVVGIAGVVGVLVAVLAMGAGFAATLTQTGADDTVIVTQTGARSEASSAIGHDAVAVISQAPQVLKNSQGRPIASPELLVVASLLNKSRGVAANVAIRGVGESAWELRPHIQIVEGRRFKSGMDELLVGKGVHHEFAGADIGSSLTLNGHSWRVVGVFDAGDGHNSEIWGDTEIIASAFHRLSGKTSVGVRLVDASAFDTFKAGLASDPRLRVDAQTTRQYYAHQSEGISRMARILGITVGTIMAIGAVFGALNTTYSAVAARSREIATLRAIGFGRLPVIVSVLLETMLLATLGGLIGVAIAWAIFDGFRASTLGANGQVIFAFRVSSGLLWNGLQWALAIGLIGGLFPAVRAARMPIPFGLRDS